MRKEVPKSVDSYFKKQGSKSVVLGIDPLRFKQMSLAFKKAPFS